MSNKRLDTLELSLPNVINYIISHYKQESKKFIFIWKISVFSFHIVYVSQKLQYQI